MWVVEIEHCSCETEDDGLDDFYGALFLGLDGRAEEANLTKERVSEGPPGDLDDWVSQDSDPEEGPEDRPVQLVEEAQLWLSSHHESLTGEADEDGAEDETKDEGAEVDIVDDALEEQ